MKEKTLYRNAVDVMSMTCGGVWKDKEQPFKEIKHIIIDFLHLVNDLYQLVPSGSSFSLFASFSVTSQQNRPTSRSINTFLDFGKIVVS